MPLHPLRSALATSLLLAGVIALPNASPQTPAIAIGPVTFLDAGHDD